MIGLAARPVRNVYYVIWTPATFEPLFDRSPREFKPHVPVGGQKPVVSILKVQGATRILGLVPHVKPSTVSRLIVAVVVDPVQRIAVRRNGAHIGQEIGERRIPPVTHPDSPASPIFIGGVVIGTTPASHSDPCFMFKRSGHSVLEVIISLPSLKTSATLFPPGKEVCRFNRKFASTFTSAIPPRASPSDPCVGHNHKSGKMQAYKVHPSPPRVRGTKLNIHCRCIFHAFTLAHDGKKSSAMAKAKPKPAGGGK